MNVQNRHLTALPSKARTATVSSGDLPNLGSNGCHVIVDVTAVNATPSITVDIEGKDPTSGKYYTILSSAAITTVSTNVYKVFPGATGAANLRENDELPAQFRITVNHADADSITYSVGVNLQ